MQKPRKRLTDPGPWKRRFFFKPPSASGSKRTFNEFIRHPIVLLVLGAATGLGGQWFLTSWQRREWDRQQDRLLTVKNLDQRYELPQEILKAAEQYHNAIEDYLRWLRIQEFNGKFGEDDLGNQAKMLVQAFDTWRANGIIIDQKLKLFYKSQEIHTTFDKIQRRREQITGNTFVLHANYLLGEEKRVTKEMETTIEETRTLIAEDSKQIAELITMMTNETAVDLKNG